WLQLRQRRVRHADLPRHQLVTVRHRVEHGALQVRAAPLDDPEDGLLEGVGVVIALMDGLEDSLVLVSESPAQGEARHPVVEVKTALHPAAHTRSLRNSSVLFIATPSITSTPIWSTTAWQCGWQFSFSHLMSGFAASSISFRCFSVMVTSRSTGLSRRSSTLRRPAAA